MADDRYQKGMKVMTAHLGPTAASYVEAMVDQ